MKILVIDNDVSIGVTIKTALGLNASYEVVVCLGAKEGLEEMRKNSYDLVLLDFMMPDISGVDLCKTMAADEKLKNIPVILISALPITSEVFQKSNDNFNEISVVKGLLEKPFNVAGLLGKVEAVLNMKK
ncbi:MAG: response regulator [Patescibacteria group bacterium]|jgi:two-component system phosphate regulon response regulator PhoB